MPFLKTTKLEQHGLKGSADRSSCPEHLFFSGVIQMSGESEKEKGMGQ